jgi:hypothetical protein
MTRFDHESLVRIGVYLVNDSTGWIETTQPPGNVLDLALVGISS